MRIIKKNILLLAASMAFVACQNDDSSPVANSVILEFENTFKEKAIVLGDANSDAATVNISAAGQEHQFSELKYVISNIRLVKHDGTEFPYHINNLDEGAFIVNQSKVESLRQVLHNIPAGSYKQIKLGLGVRNDLNELDEMRFPEFYKEAEENDTEMMWEWGTGYRFTKIEGFYDSDKKQMSIHTGSTLEDDDAKENLVQGVDAYRDIVLDLPTWAEVGNKAPVIRLRADFDKLLSGMDKITLSTGKGPNDNATPNIHTADQMVRFVNNLGGDGENDTKGMFSILEIQN